MRILLPSLHPWPSSHMATLTKTCIHAAWLCSWLLSGFQPVFVPRSTRNKLHFLSSCRSAPRWWAYWNPFADIEPHLLRLQPPGAFHSGLNINKYSCRTAFDETLKMALVVWLLDSLFCLWKIHGGRENPSHGKGRFANCCLWTPWDLMAQGKEAADLGKKSKINKISH